MLLISRVEHKDRHHAGHLTLSEEVEMRCEPPQAQLEVSEDVHRITLKNVSLYSILFLKEQ